MIDRNDLLMITSYEDIVKELMNEYSHLAWTDENPLVYCPLEHIPELFERLKANSSRPKFTLISANSDYGIFEQRLDHPNFDIYKSVMATAFPSKEQLPIDNYAEFRVAAPCHPRCNSKHKYSVKMDRYTDFTFDEVPEQIDKWYVTNLNVVHPKMSLIPFGLNPQGNGTDILYEKMKPSYDQKSKGLIYVNFQDYCMRRINLKRFISSRNLPNVTIDPIANLPVNHFLEKIKGHLFTICAPGNGLDSYRAMEATYLGSIPVFEESVFSRQLSKILPCCLIVNSYEEFCSQDKDQILNSLDYYIGSANYRMVTRKYWKDVFAQQLTSSGV